MRLISVLLLFCSLLFSSQQTIEINFKNLKIDDFVKMVSKITGKNILLTAPIRGSVNFVAVKPIDKSQVYDLLISVLKNKGYTLIDSRSGFLEVVRSADAAKESPPFRGKSKINQIQTDIVGIKNLSASQMLLQIKFLLSKYGKISVSKEANSIIITDYPKNLASIRLLIKKLDSQKSMDIEFYRLKNSKVKLLLPKIKNIASTLYNQKMPSQKITIFGDESTNTLILISRREIINKIISYIKNLDKADTVSQRYLHIVSLKNSNALELAKTLDRIVAKKPISSISTINKVKSSKSKKKSKVNLQSTTNKRDSSDKITFTADKETNILVVYASKEEFKEIKRLIDALDMPRQQVYISAKVIEISNIKSSQIGAKYGVLGGVANSSGLYSFSANLGAPAIPFDLSSLGLDTPSISKGLALGATISLLNSSGAADVISEPSLLCVNNLESSIYVGKTESVITQSSVGAATTDVTKNTYTREDIGLTLKVKPRISSDNKVAMDIKVTTEDIAPGSEVGLPITTKRDVATTAIVKNGESIIIGGLVKNKLSKTISKVPLLSDVPILGNLFTHTQNDGDKLSLVIILTPYIVNSSSNLSQLREVLVKLNKIEQQFLKNVEKNANKSK